MVIVMVDLVRRPPVPISAPVTVVIALAVAPHVSENARASLMSDFMMSHLPKQHTTPQKTARMWAQMPAILSGFWCCAVSGVTLLLTLDENRYYLP